MTFWKISRKKNNQKLLRSRSNLVPPCTIFLGGTACSFHGYPQCNSIWWSSCVNDQRFHYGIHGLLRPKYWTKDVWEYQKRLMETSAVSQDVLIREGMTKLTGGSGNITDFLRIPNKPAFGWIWSVGIIGSLKITIGFVLTILKEPEGGDLTREHCILIF